MSTWDDDMTAVIAVVRAALTGAMPLGALGGEIGFRQPDQLSSGEMPHLFVFNPRDSATPLDFLQEDVTTTIQAELYVRNTRTIAAGYCTAIKDAVAADATLGGTARRFRISAIGLIEDRGHDADLVVVLEFQVQRTASPS